MTVPEIFLYFIIYILLFPFEICTSSTRAPLDVAVHTDTQKSTTVQKR